jgi:hypothetical protein
MTYSLDELEGMIPLYLNGRLTAAEREALEAGLRRHPELEAELKDFSAIKESYGVVANPPEIDADALFARVQKGLHGERRMAPDAIKEGPVEQLMQFLRRIYHTPSLSWSMAGLQFAALLFIFFLAPRPAVFKTYSADPAANSEMVHLNVVFDKAATEIEIRSLLLKLGAVISSGPSAEGLYVLAVDKTADIDALIRQLKVSPIVRLAEKTLSSNHRKPLHRVFHAMWKRTSTLSPPGSGRQACGAEVAIL